MFESSHEVEVRGRCLYFLDYKLPVRCAPLGGGTYTTPFPLLMTVDEVSWVKRLREEKGQL